MWNTLSVPGLHRHDVEVPDRVLSMVQVEPFENLTSSTNGMMINLLVSDT